MIVFLSEQDSVKWNTQYA